MYIFLYVDMPNETAGYGRFSDIIIFYPFVYMMTYLKNNFFESLNSFSGCKHSVYHDIIFHLQVFLSVQFPKDVSVRDVIECNYYIVE